MSEKNKKKFCKKKSNSHSLHKGSPKVKILTPVQQTDSLFESLEDLPFSNKHIKKQLKEHHTKNSLSGGDSSTRIHEEKRPYGEYYGSETSIFTHRQHRSTELSSIKRTASQSKKKQLDNTLVKLIKKYRQLQLNHREQEKEMSSSLSQIQMRRLKTIHQYELKQTMEAIVDVEEHIWLK